MLEPFQKPTGTRYTTTVTLLLMAFVFSPVFLYLNKPVEIELLVLMIGISAACVGFAVRGWRHSALSIPTIRSGSSSARPGRK